MSTLLKGFRDEYALPSAGPFLFARSIICGTFNLCFKSKPGSTERMKDKEAGPSDKLFHLLKSDEHYNAALNLMMHCTQIKGDKRGDRGHAEECSVRHRHRVLPERCQIICQHIADLASKILQCLAFSETCELHKLFGFIQIVGVGRSRSILRGRIRILVSDSVNVYMILKNFHPTLAWGEHHRAEICNNTLPFFYNQVVELSKEIYQNIDYEDVKIELKKCPNVFNDDLASKIMNMVITNNQCLQTGRRWAVRFHEFFSAMKETKRALLEYFDPTSKLK
ncbi:hypothetical protein HELRODRAFT_182814 [Helobdella robusta]|uniref:Uncharacterized protein n=1 Tax=Helobdella robusta TaxID=6412 RepID=T1FIS6_HELRO|nr:hypothetical protein HELRODRAFT_182814 [Helobdella robusta]ESN90118.1 hypothetical protein HELRODRAFT_182814 [Helobdella robusta]